LKKEGGLYENGENTKMEKVIEDEGNDNI